MEERASEALQQIKEKSYAADLKYRGVKEIISYGIAFSGKKACVKCEKY
ncbi:MAG: PD-(D/E)XK nuclease domain-containing protein [Clostridiales bacterium]|nr:PD-(D/E)XK nuclease domain-containing protein [Lachnospiraceae bacterium]MDD6618295.1 PD-(D/E)XK nuclease domain-containing protein [Clostridiales bacterium]